MEITQNCFPFSLQVFKAHPLEEYYDYPWSSSMVTPTSNITGKALVKRHENFVDSNRKLHKLTQKGILSSAFDDGEFFQQIWGTKKTTSFFFDSRCWHSIFCAFCSAWLFLLINTSTKDLQRSPVVTGGNSTEPVPSDADNDEEAKPNTALLSTILCLGTFWLATTLKAFKTSHYLGKTVWNTKKLLL